MLQFEHLEDKRLLTVNVEVVHDPAPEALAGDEVTRVIRVFADDVSQVRVRSSVMDELDNATWERVTGYGKRADFVSLFGPEKAPIEGVVGNIQPLGDLNGDGLNDSLVIVQPERISRQRDTYIVSGSAELNDVSNESLEELVVAGTAVKWNDSSPGGFRSISFVVKTYPIGDFNNDGYNDAVIVSSTTPQLLYGGETLEDRTVSLTGFNTIDVSLYNDEADLGGLPFRVAGADDINGDDINDIVFSFSNNNCLGCTAGQRVFEEHAGGAAVVFGGKDANGELFVPNMADNRNFKIDFNSRVSVTVDDYDEDGFADIALRADSARYFFSGRSEQQNYDLGHVDIPYQGFNGQNGFDFTEPLPENQPTPPSQVSASGTGDIDEVLQLDTNTSAIYTVSGTKRGNGDALTSIAMPVTKTDIGLEDNIASTKTPVSVSAELNLVARVGDLSTFEVRIANDGPFDATSVELVESLTSSLTDVTWERNIKPYAASTLLTELPPGMGATLQSPEVVRIPYEGYENRYLKLNSYLEQPVYRTLGFVVGSDGDTNSDGIDDIFVATRAGFYRPPAHNYGYARLEFNGASDFGNLGDFPDSSSETDPTAAEHPALENQVGDINGDGIVDEVSTINRSVVVRFGNATGTFPDIDQLDGTNGFTIPIVRTDFLETPSEVGDITIGDLNNDGFDDVIVSESLDMVSELEASVSVHAVYGRPAFQAEFDLGTVNGSNGFSLQSESHRSWGSGPRRRFMSIESNFDVNGDGIDDLLIGDAYAGAFAVYEEYTDHHGEAYLIFGRQAEEASGTGTIAGQIDIPVGSEITYTITGTLEEDTAASSVDLTLAPDQIDLFMSELSFVIERNAADINQNGSVDFADFLILSSNFGQDVTPQEQGDIDGDGNVSFTDFLLLISQFGQRA